MVASKTLLESVDSDDSGIGDEDYINDIIRLLIEEKALTSPVNALTDADLHKVLDRLEQFT